MKIIREDKIQNKASGAQKHNLDIILYYREVEWKMSNFLN